MKRAVLMALLLVACGAIRITAVLETAPPDDPWNHADAIVVALEQNGAVVPGSVVRFDPGAAGLDLPHLGPLGTGLAIRVETQSGGIALGRGRSFPFDVPGGPTTVPILLGTLGSYARTVPDPLPATPRAAVATAQGALLGTDTGLLGYVAHPAGLTPLGALPPERAGAIWVATGGQLVAVGGARPGATLFGGDGQVLAQVDLTLDPLAASALALEPGVLVLGRGGALVRLDVAGGALTATAAGRLPTVPIAPQMTAVVTSDGRSSFDRAVVVDGNEILVLDPHTGPVSAPFLLPASQSARVVTALHPGILAVAGGRDGVDPTQVTGDVSYYVVHPDAVAPLLPLPTGMAPRSDATAIPFGTGLALVIGGRDGAGAAVASADLFVYDPASLPGDVAATRDLPVAMAHPVGCLLLDRTVLVAGTEGLAVYFPPRGERALVP